MNLTDVIGKIPYRMALAGGWIDQPFISKLNPDPPGSMVVVALLPTVRFMDRCGMATGTRKIASRIWSNELPSGDPAILTRNLYHAENSGKEEPSGSQDMIGLIYPGICRLDYDAEHEDGYFPKHVEQCLDETVAQWIENVFHVISVNQRPEGYNPLGVKNLDRDWVKRLGASGGECYAGLVSRDITRLGASMNECMACWEALLPNVVRHPTISHDLMALLGYYQSKYPGAMYSGCGGGYLLVVSETPVPGSFGIEVRMR